MSVHYSPIVLSAATATPNPAVHDQLVSVSVNAVSTAGAITNVTVDASAVGGGTALALFSAGGNVYTNSVVVSTATLLGVKTLTVTAQDNAGDTNTGPVSLTIVGTAEVWNGGATPVNTWAAGGNWASGFAPGPGDLVTFAGTVNLTANLESGYNLAALTFSNNAGAFNITNTANTLTLTGGVTNNSGNVQTLNVPVALAGVETFNAASNNLVFGNMISGPGGVLVTGTSTNIFAGSNSYSGPTTVSGGSTLQLANSNAVESSTLTLNSGSTLQLRANVSSVFTATNLALQNAADTLNFDVNSLTAPTGYAAVAD